MENSHLEDFKFSTKNEWPDDEIVIEEKETSYAFPVDPIKIQINKMIVDSMFEMRAWAWDPLQQLPPAPTLENIGRGKEGMCQWCGSVKAESRHHHSCKIMDYSDYFANSLLFALKTL